jgi:hypothetical protein
MQNAVGFHAQEGGASDYSRKHCQSAQSGKQTNNRIVLGEQQANQQKETGNKRTLLQ